jgi:hypothetical protein
MANGRPSNFTDKVYPPQQMGEDVTAGDLVGIREDVVDGVRRVFKAFAGVTAGDNVQCEALGVVMKDMFKGAYDGIWQWVRINGIDAVTGGGPLEDIVSGDKVYLSDTTPGLMMLDAPVGAGKLKQVVGNAYYDKKRDPRAGDLAGGIVVFIRDAVTL